MMKYLALLLIGVAIFDITMTVVKLIPERKTLVEVWKHNKKDFIPLIYITVCNILAIIVFIYYAWRG